MAHGHVNAHAMAAAVTAAQSIRSAYAVSRFDLFSGGSFYACARKRRANGIHCPPNRDVTVADFFRPVPCGIAIKHRGSRRTHERTHAPMRLREEEAATTLHYLPGLSILTMPQTPQTNGRAPQTNGRANTAESS